jgi:hypothetical protein
LVSGEELFQDCLGRVLREAAPPLRGNEASLRRNSSKAPLRGVFAFSLALIESGETCRHPMDTRLPLNAAETEITPSDLPVKACFMMLVRSSLRMIPSG